MRGKAETRKLSAEKSTAFAAYRAAAQQVMERLPALTSLVEQISIDAAGERGKLKAER